MRARIAIVGAGVTGLTCAAVLAERGYATHVFAARDAESSATGAAAAIWFPYDATPPELAVAWGMFTYARLAALAGVENTGVSMIDFRFFSAETLLPPAWTEAIACRLLPRDEILAPYASGFAMRVPLMDSPVYLAWLRGRVRGEITYGVRFDALEDVDERFDIIVNCTGYGARALVGDDALEAHRGQVVIAERVELPFAFVSDDRPLTYVIPRSRDCILGGSNEISESEEADPVLRDAIVTQCSRVVGAPLRARDDRVGLRPFRRSGVRVESERLRDGRIVVHDYGHGGAGYSLSWGCAHKAAELVSRHIAFDR